MKLLRSLILISVLAGATACGSGNPTDPGVSPTEVSPRLDGNGTMGSGG